MPRTRAKRLAGRPFRIQILGDQNGRFRQSIVCVLDAENNTQATEKGDLAKQAELEKVVSILAEKAKVPRARMLKAVTEEWRRYMDKVRQAREAAATGHPDGVSAGGKDDPATALIRLGRELPLYRDHDDFTYAEVRLKTGKVQTVPISTSGVGLWLRRQYYKAADKGVSEASLKTAIATLESIALEDGTPTEVFVRLGVTDDNSTIVLDLADEGGNVVVITPEGWSITPRSPVRFWRPRGMRPLPRPVGGGTLDPLWDVVNVEEEDRVLVAAWLLEAINPWGPYTGLFLHGPQGTAKSTVAGFLRGLVDPNKCPLRQPPRDEDALVLAARNGLVVGLDNLSHISQELSDCLSRLLTGGGIGKRKLYTDADEVLLDIKRPLIVTGIPDLVRSGDLADRAIALLLPPIPNEKRKLEREVKECFAASHPPLLGALLDAAVHALRNHRTGRLTTYSRMADFENWVVAGLEVLGFDPEDFLEVYRGNKGDAAQVVIDSSLVASALVQMMGQLKEWQGTTRDLLVRLGQVNADYVRHKNWPESPRGLTGELRRLAPALEEAAGIKVSPSERTGHDRQRVLVVTKVGGQRSSAVVPERSSASSASSAEGGWSGEIPF
jgi:hypothetical protein